MGFNYAAAWQHAIKVVQDWCSTPEIPDTAEAAAAYHSMLRFVQPLCTLETPPQAVWKDLVMQLKVGPTTVAGLAATVAQAGSTSACLALGWQGQTAPVNKASVFWFFSK